MKDFYVYLPSNSLFLADNKASKYVTKLAKELNLGSRWECCLKEIHYPRSWNTLTGDEGNFYVHRLSVNMWELKSIPTGYYSDGQQIVNALNHSLKSIKATAQLLEHSGIVKLSIPADVERRLRNTNSPITRLKWPPTSAFTAVSTIQESVLRT